MIPNYNHITTTQATYVLEFLERKIVDQYTKYVFDAVWLQVSILHILKQRFLSERPVDYSI